MMGPKSLSIPRRFGIHRVDVVVDMNEALTLLSTPQRKSMTVPRLRVLQPPLANVVYFVLMQSDT